MPLNIKDPETELLAREVAQLTGESKTGAIRTALREWLESEVWPSLPAGVRGQAPTQAEQDALLGYDAMR
jgi:antitoxin VapB